SFVLARSMFFPVIRSLSHLSIAFKANIAYKKWAIIKNEYWLYGNNKRLVTAYFCLIVLLEMLDNKLDFVQILSSVCWIDPLNGVRHDGANNGKEYEYQRRNIPRANRRFV
ncbi:hypothetical protein KR032_001421, partial [Drosophila birchii]